jgi:histone H2A
MATPKKSGSAKKARAPAAAKGGKKAGGLTFPAGRVGSLLRRGRYSKRVSKAAAVYLTAVLEYLTAELLELSSKVVKAGTTRITPRTVTTAVRLDADLGTLLKDVTLSRGGVIGKVNEALEKKKKGAKKSKKATKSTPKA